MRVAVTWLLLVGGAASVQLSYDRDYPAVRYASAAPDDPVAKLKASLASGEARLRFDAEGNGYLGSLLAELKIPISSQLLVFTKTSFQKGRISPETPRAVYFGDDAYVGWVQNGPSIEIAGVDPELGVSFYTLAQDGGGRPELERQTFLCLRCHDSYSMTGGGVPRHILGSGIPDATGRLLSHEGWYLTSPETPIEKRWGGWYVTGTHGSQRHLGNLYAAPGTTELDFDAGANVVDLGARIDTSPYLGEHSDIVALLVLEHQIHVQNRIVRASWETRQALAASEAPDLERHVEPLVQAMLFAGEAPLLHPVEGTSSFARDFERRGRFDAEGRTLRELDLKTRVFRYACSYLVHSRAFDGLPAEAKSYVYRRFREELDGDDPETRATVEILKATKPDFAELVEGAAP